MKIALKKTVSLMLTVVMLVSCWVFVAPKSDAATADSYWFRITFKVTNAGDFDQTYEGYNKTGKDRGGFSLLYKANNGTGTQHEWLYDMSDKKHNSSEGNINTEGTFTVSGTLSGFPYLMSAYCMNDSWGKAYFRLQKLELGTSSSNCKTVWEGNLQVDSQLNGYGGWVSQTSNGSWDKGVTAFSTTSRDWPSPAATSVSDITGDASVNVPTDGGTNTKAYSLGTVKDQYGVNWYQDSTWDTATVSNGVTFSNGTLTVPASSNRSSNYTVTLKQVRGSASSTKTVTITTFDYYVTFYDENGTTVLKSTQTIDYGGSATAPSSNPTKAPDNSNHYTFSSWTGDTYTSLTTGKQTRKVTASYSAANHSFTSKTQTSTYLKSAATCDDDAVYYYKCSGCTKSAQGIDNTKYYTAANTALGHSYTAWTDNFTSDGTHDPADYHYRYCVRVNSHTEYALHDHSTISYNVAEAPQGATIKADYDPEAEHYSVCPTCGNVKYTPHSYTEDVANSKPATCYETGYKHMVCACGKSYNDPTPMIDHTFANDGAYTTVLAATCTTAGSEQRACIADGCSYIEERTIPATGHDYYEIYTAPTNGTAGSVCYGCNNGCGKYWTATYDSDTYTPATEYSSLAQAKRNTPASAKVSPPKFNAYYSATIDYNYATRGASLKIAEPFGFTDRNTRQGLRFTASLHVPEGVDYSGDNNIVDFGFIYSQTNNSYVNNNINNLTLDNVDRDVKKIVKMSVKDNNADKGTFNGSNWTGVTAHADETLGGTTLTYNLVVNVKAYNWSENYCARAYVVYNYNGHEYTVYDNQFSSRSVEYIANAVVQNTDVETPKVINYCQTKILTPISQGLNVQQKITR